MPVRLYSFNRIFYGLRSQCIILFFLRNYKAASIWIANLRIRSKLSPLQLFLMMSSYKFSLIFSNSKQTCLRNITKSLILMILLQLLLSFSLILVRIYISMKACFANFCRFRIILRATFSFFLWSNTKKTWPYEPFPIRARISYLYAIWSWTTKLYYFLKLITFYSQLSKLSSFNQNFSAFFALCPVQ